MKKYLLLFVSLMIVASVMLSACQPAAESEPETVVVSEPETVVEETEPETAVEEPTELKIAIITTTPTEEPWNTVLLQALDRVIAEKPHGLEITYVFQELIATPDGERVMRDLAQSGEYGIIWGHSVYPDAIVNLSTEFPDLVFAGSGSGYEPMSDNAYWVNMYVHESAYLLGMIAGSMSETGVIGAVAGFPFANVNLPIQAYKDGAKAVNPDIEFKMNYIDSWYDPAKAKEYSLAQIAAGADFIYAERFGPFEAAKEMGVYAFGHYADQNELAPDVVVSSAMAYWDPAARYLIDAWWEHTVNGVPYNAPTDTDLYFLMAEGGTDLAPYHGFEDQIPQEVKDLVDQTRQDIKDGTLVLDISDAEVTSD